MIARWAVLRGLRLARAWLGRLKLLTRPGSGATASVDDRDHLHGTDLRPGIGLTGPPRAAH